MRRDPTEFRKRFLKWKSGAKPYLYGIPYEDDNHNLDYDQARANQLGYTADETGHYPTRDYETGRYLKSVAHPTVSKSIYTDMGLGYDILYNDKDKSLYSQPNFGSTYKERLPKFEDGKAGLTPYKYSWDSDSNSWNRYTADLMGETFNNFVATPNKSRVRFNYEKQPVVQRMPLAESDTLYTQRRILEEQNHRSWRSDAADLIDLGIAFTPAGNAKYAMDAVYSGIKGDYKNAAMLGLSAVVPGIAKKIIKPVLKKTEPLIKKTFEAYNNMSFGDQTLTQLTVPITLGSIPGVYGAITSDDALESLEYLGLSAIGGGIGAYGGLKFAEKLEPKLLKKYYGVNRNGVKPQLSENSITSDALFVYPEQMNNLEERNKVTRSMVKHTMNKLKPGDSYALIDDVMLSTDSAPLYFAELARHRNAGSIRTVKNKSGEVTMSRLNKFGENHNVSDINKSIELLRKYAGVDVPDAKKVGSQIYIPLVYITK